MWGFIPSLDSGIVKLTVRALQDIMSESATSKEKKSKAEIEQLVKMHGGRIFQTENAAENTQVIGDRSVTSHLHVTSVYLFLPM